MTHGICERCDARLDAGERLITTYRERIELHRAIRVAAMAGDEGACTGLAQRARDLGVGPVELLVGLLQPSLVDVGARWESGVLTVEDEHRFTAWCEAMLALVRQPTPADPLELLLVPVPGNQHTLGVRFAEQVLLAWGLRVAAVVAPRSVDELVALVRTRAPEWVGLSCSLPESLPLTGRLAAALAEAGFAERVLLSGQVLRLAPELPVPPGLVVCPTLEDAWRVLRGGQAPATT